MSPSPGGAARMHELLGQAESIFPGGSMGSYAVPPWMNLVVARAEGSRLHAVDGRSYLDYILGSGPLILGHANPGVVRAVREQVARGSTFYALNEPIIELGRTIIDAVPCAETILFASSGAEATFFAMRLARAFTRRELVLRFAGAYHGHHDYSKTDSAGVPKAVTETVLVAPFNDIEAVRRELASHEGQVAAVLVEPLHRGYRITQPQPGFLADLKRAAYDAGALLIFDEVVTGFRLARGGGQERYGVTPDLATYGKVIGGGYPVSAVCGRGDVMELASPRRADEPDYVFFSGTLNGNPIGASAGLATLAQLVGPEPYARLNHAGEMLRTSFNAAAREFDLPLMMVGEGSVGGVELTEDDGRAAEVRATLFPHLGRALLERGIATGLERVYVSLAHTDEDLAETAKAFCEALAEVKRQSAA